MPSQVKYAPPKVWKWDQPSGGAFASTNRPIAGATHDKDLPLGKHPFQLYSLATPNGVKVSILFEELLEAGHEVLPLTGLLYSKLYETQIEIKHHINELDRLKHDIEKIKEKHDKDS